MIWRDKLSYDYMPLELEDYTYQLHHAFSQQIILLRMFAREYQGEYSAVSLLKFQTLSAIMWEAWL